MARDSVKVEITPEMIEAWVAHFLWHWAQSGVSPEKAAGVIASIYRTDLSDDGQNSTYLLQDQQAILKALESS